MHFFVRVAFAVLFAIAPLSILAKSVTIKFIQENHNQESIDEGKGVSAILVGADNYFTGAEYENLSLDSYSVLFGAKPANGDYNYGKLTLTLSDWFKAMYINSVAVKASYFTVKMSTDKAERRVYLWANSVKSDKYINMYNIDYTLTCEINSQCDELTLLMAGESQDSEYDCRVDVLSLTIDYDEPTTVDPTAGISSINAGTWVSLSGCVVSTDGSGYVAHVLKTTDRGGVEIVDNQPLTYTIPVTDCPENKLDTFVNLYGTIEESDGTKHIKIQTTATATPSVTHSQPAIYVNGAEIDNYVVINADDQISFSHELGENVAIYYVKRTGAKIDPSNATTDPALVSTSQKVSATRKTESQEVPDESGTFLYTGPFQLVHSQNLATTSQSDVALSLAVYSGSTLTAGAAFQASDTYTITNAITTGINSIIASDDENTVKYVDIQGRPVATPIPGQLLIRITPSGAQAVVVK